MIWPHKRGCPEEYARHYQGSRSGPSMQNIKSQEIQRTLTFAPGFPQGASVGSFPEPRFTMNGNRLDIQASVDLAGLKKLKEMLTKFEGILEMMQTKDEAAN